MKKLFVMCLFLLTLGFAPPSFTYCRMSLSPAGIYKKETSGVESKATSETSSQSAAVNSSAKGLEVCPDPNAPCHSVGHKFAAYELAFRLPARLRAGKQYKSVPFYALILKTYDEETCDADDHTASIERERLRIQKQHPTRKVFGSYSCPNLAAVDYDFPGKLDSSGERVLIQTFIAVYAGKSSAEANELLTSVRKLFPQAVIKRMTAGYEIIDQ